MTALGAGLRRFRRAFIIQGLDDPARSTAASGGLVRPGDRGGAVRIFEFMSANQADFPIAAMARVPCVSESGYHAWRGRAPSARAVEDKVLLKKVRTVHATSRDVWVTEDPRGASGQSPRGLWKRLPIDVGQRNFGMFRKRTWTDRKPRLGEAEGKAWRYFRAYGSLGRPGTA